MHDKTNNPCGWSGTIHDFLSVQKQDWLTSLLEHHQRCMNCPADESQYLAWAHSFDILQAELGKLNRIQPDSGKFSIIFEYELPRERGRRPDVVILGSSTIVVLEFKDYSKILQAHVDQVDAYCTGPETLSCRVRTLFGPSRSGSRPGKRPSPDV
jgi:hypothetical protein